jgi:hypothetical protein
MFIFLFFKKNVHLFWRNQTNKRTERGDQMIKSAGEIEQLSRQMRLTCWTDGAWRFCSSLRTCGSAGMDMKGCIVLRNEILQCRWARGQRGLWLTSVPPSLAPSPEPARRTCTFKTANGINTVGIIMFKSCVNLKPPVRSETTFPVRKF